MALAYLPLVAQDELGNKLDGASVLIRNADTLALPTPYSDRAGTAALGNPYTAPDGGAAGCYLIGGFYRIDITKDAVTRTEYRPVGTSQEYDLVFPLVPYVTGDIPYASAPGVVSMLAAVAIGAVLVSGGEGAPSAWSRTPSLDSLALGGAVIGTNALAVTGLAEFNTGWVSNITQPTLQVPFPGFNGDRTTPTYYVGSSNIITFTGSTALGATALTGQAVVTTTADISANAGEVGGVYGGALNQKAGADPYGILGSIYNDDNAASNPGGPAIWAIVRGTQASGGSSTQVNAFRATSEVVTNGQYPFAALLVTDNQSVGIDNSFRSGVHVTSANTYGVFVGSELTDRTYSVPTYAFASNSVNGGPFTFYVNGLGNIFGTGQVLNGGASNTTLILDTGATNLSANIRFDNNSTTKWYISNALTTNLFHVVDQVGGFDVLSSASNSGIVDIRSLRVGVARSIASATNAILDDLNVQAATTTITGNTGSPITKLSKVGLYRPTLTDSSVVTVSDASTLYIDNSPLAAGSVTITRPWSLWAAAGKVLFGATAPNAANAGQLNVNSGSNKNVIVAGSTVSNVSISAYYNGPVFFYQLGDNTVNNTQAIDFRSANASKNSYAMIAGQITDVTDGAVKGKLILGTANGAGSASNYVYLEPTGCLNVGTDADLGAGIINATASLYVAGVKVVGARVTGYTAMTGSPDKAAAYATSTVTLPQLAGRVAQIQADLTTHGLLAA